MSIEAVDFTQNTAVGYGGGIVAESCFLSLGSSTFNNNKANSGAGIRVLNMKDQNGNAITPLQIAENFKKSSNSFAGNVAQIGQADIVTKCVIGEYYVDGLCEICKANTYNLVVEDNQGCKACQNQISSCPGSYVIQVRYGYWRPN